MDNPEVSIIVPIYNMENYLKQCICSVLNQTFIDYELILVDDGSTDHSGLLCDQYKKSNQNIKVIHQKNQGLSAARNTGIKAAKGKYICFVDADDILDKYFLSVLYSLIKQYNADVSWCGFSRFWDENCISTQNNQEVILRTKEELWDMLTSIGTNCNSTEFVISCNKMIIADKVKQLSFPVGKWHEDEFFSHRLLDACDSFVETKQQLYYYRQRKNSIIGEDNQYDIRHLDFLDAFEERITYCKNSPYKKYYRKFVHSYRIMINYYMSLFKNRNKWIYYKLRCRLYWSKIKYSSKLERVKNEIST